MIKIISEKDVTYLVISAAYALMESLVNKVPFSLSKVYILSFLRILFIRISRLKFAC